MSLRWICLSLSQRPKVISRWEYSFSPSKQELQACGLDVFSNTQIAFEFLFWMKGCGGTTSDFLQKRKPETWDFPRQFGRGQGGCRERSWVAAERETGKLGEGLRSGVEGSCFPRLWSSRHETQRRLPDSESKRPFSSRRKNWVDIHLSEWRMVRIYIQPNH